MENQPQVTNEPGENEKQPIEFKTLEEEKLPIISKECMEWIWN